jgi:hypothetical protein
MHGQVRFAGTEAAKRLVDGGTQLGGIDLAEDVKAAPIGASAQEDGRMPLRDDGDGGMLQRVIAPDAVGVGQPAKTCDHRDAPEKVQEK